MQERESAGPGRILGRRRMPADPPENRTDPALPVRSPPPVRSGVPQGGTTALRNAGWRESTEDIAERWLTDLGEELVMFVEGPPLPRSERILDERYGL
jgi:hypothetical protein